jgi:hypothetical protein
MSLHSVLQFGKWVKRPDWALVEQSERLELHGEVESSPSKWDLDIDVRHSVLAADIGHNLQVKSLHETPSPSCSKLQNARPRCRVFVLLCSSL